MIASKTNSEEAVELLLRNGANPDVVVKFNDEEYNALKFAIEAENILMVCKLMEVTNDGLKISYNKLTDSGFDWKKDEDAFTKLTSIIMKNIEVENDLFHPFIESAAEFGNKIWLRFLRLEFPNLFKKLSPENIHKILELAIHSDDADACRELVQVENFVISEEIKSIARSCGKTEIIKAFEAEGEEEATNEDKEEIMFKDAIKSEDFPYMDNIEKLIKEFLRKKKLKQRKRIVVQINEIVKSMMAPTVHYNTENEDCPMDCKQPRICLRIRQTQQLIKDLLNKIAETYPVFKDCQLIMVGSLKEGTKIGFIDEADVALIMNKKYQKPYFEFDEKNQQIKLTRRYNQNGSKLPEELATFVTDDGIFDCTKYFKVFVEEMHKTIEKKLVKLPDGLSLTVDYTPCNVCRSDEDLVPQYIRCRHQPDCEEHQKKKDDPKYQEKCQCKIFNFPSISISKIGIVLHLLFQEKTGPFVIDVDVNPPVLFVPNVKLFRGSNRMKRSWLRKNRHKIRNWRPEYRKTQDMSEAGNVEKKDARGNPEIAYEDGIGYYYTVLVGNRSVRLRLVNRNMVIPEQVGFLVVSFK